MPGAPRKVPPMSEVHRRFVRSTTAATAIEYALIAMGVALVIVAAVGAVGAHLNAYYDHIAAAFP
jgi:pilus assembly protein Flp/PilA